MGAVALPALDDYSAFVRAGADGTAEIDIAVKGARCANCLAKIEKGVKALPDVKDARLNLSTGRLRVIWTGERSAASAIIQRLVALGYDAAPFEAAASLEADEAEGRDLLRCLAIAGFGSVFVVGLTDAIWYGGGDLSAATRSVLFGIAAIVSVPVTLYAGRPFFNEALKALRKRQTNMDLPIALALLLSLGLSLYQTATGAEHTYFDAAVMLAFLLLVGRYLDFGLRDRARSAARHLVTLQSALARRIRSDGTVETVAARELEPGDRVLLASGERAATDGTLESGTEADISLVTGESEPVRLAAGGAVRAGSIIVGPAAVLRTSARVEDSLVADLGRLLEAGQQARGLYVRLADRAARAYVPFVTIASLAVLAAWLILGAPVSTAVTNAIAVLIVTCPCALGLAVPAVQIVATGRLFDRGVFVKSGTALERLAEIDTAVFDKTGTLTFGTPVLDNAVQLQSGALAAAAALARASRHPMARALADAAGPGPAATGVRETPGAGLEVVNGGKTQRLGNAAWCGAGEAVQSGELWFRDNDAAPVRFLFRDHIRPETREALARLSSRKIALEMLTGDHAQPAARIAAQAGIAFWKANVGPGDKAARMQALRAAGRRALMVGDGINDAGALALAHVSIAPGSAADVSQRSADLVLRNGDLDSIVEAVDVARKARRLVLQNFAFAALYNVAAIPLAASGHVTPLVASIAMAGSSLAVTLNALRLARRTGR